jgi:hypothetical protein
MLILSCRASIEPDKSQKWQYSGNFHHAKEKGLKLALPKSLILWRAHQDSNLGHPDS